LFLYLRAKLARLPAEGFDEKLKHETGKLRQNPTTLMGIAQTPADAFQNSAQDGRAAENRSKSET
jgi:hypothetical protein